MGGPEKVSQRSVLWCLAQGDGVDVGLKPHMMRRRSGKDGIRQQKIRAEIAGNAGYGDKRFLFCGIFHRRVKDT